MMVRLRDRSPLARMRSSLSVASSAKPCDWKPRVHCRWRGGLERFFRRSTRTFFFLAINRTQYDSAPPAVLVRRKSILLEGSYPVGSVCQGKATAGAVVDQQAAIEDIAPETGLIAQRTKRLFHDRM